MPYVLDGNNLVGSVRRTSRPSEEDRQALVREIADRLRRTKARAILFFDGSGGSSSLGPLSVRHSGKSSADDAIVGLIESSRAPQEYVVITADHGLTRRARDAGAKTLKPDDFWKRFGATPEGAESRDDKAPVDVDEWTAYFGDDRNRDR